jgi:hypothetical protein
MPTPSRIKLVGRPPPPESDIPDVVKSGKCNALIVDVVKSADGSIDILCVISLNDERFLSVIVEFEEN